MLVRGSLPQVSLYVDDRKMAVSRDFVEADLFDLPSGVDDSGLHRRTPATAFDLGFWMRLFKG